MRVVSPCIKDCVIVYGKCRGCNRTLKEIGDMPTISQIKEMKRKLDEQDVPREDRCFNYTDLNGHTQIINHNSIITFKQMRLMPEHIKALFTCGDLDGK